MNASIKKLVSLSAVFAGALVLVSLANVAQAETLGRSLNHFERVQAYDEDFYQVAFVGGATASVTVIGDGDTDLDLYVYDDNGNLVACDNDATDTCIATWRPWRTGIFTIRIVNHGGVYNRYLISTN